MNVIMPTAMVTMHKDPDLADNSLKTSQRGIKVLKALLDKPGVKEQCEAIRSVAMGDVDMDEGNDKDIKVSSQCSIAFFINGLNNET